MSYQYSSYYEDDSDDNLSDSSSDNEGVPDDIVIASEKYGVRRRFRLERSRSSSRERQNPRSSSHLNTSNYNLDTGSVSLEEEFEKELDRTVEEARAVYDRQIDICTSGHCGSSSTQIKSVDVELVPDKDEYKSNEGCDDLFYDPDVDQADEKWMDNIRKQYQPKVQPTSPNSLQGAKPLPKSDAVLNCPACMTLLCVDCQRHDLYSHQYRAMFVFNCKVNHNQPMRYQEKVKPIPKRKSRNLSHSVQSKSEEMASTSTDELYSPVQCAICNTCVAMFDSDEVYHFFNVLASHAS